MKTAKKFLALFMSLIMVFALCGNALAVSIDEASWEKNWKEQENEINSAVTMFPGSNESSRSIAWYSESDEGYVLVTGENATEKVTAKAKKTAQGDYRLSSTLENLNEGTYTYQCFSGDYVSETYSFTVESRDDVFTAMYVTDIHVSEQDESYTLCEEAYRTNMTFSLAADKAKANGDSLDLILSAGDQASLGLRSEYVGLSANEVTKTLPIATSIGNHDRKSVDYKYYTALPNESSLIKFKSYIGTDYWFRQGDVLFLMFDSNNASMAGHRLFAMDAVAKNKDCKWRVAVFHHDLYGGRIPHRESENAFLRFMWANIADEFGIDLCLLGHSHYYTVSNVLYCNKTVETLGKDSVITDPKGTIYMVSGSINHPRDVADSEGNEPPVGENIGYSYLTNEMIYNLLEFRQESITVKSYTVESDEMINSFTINKSDKKGGHTYISPLSFLDPLVHFVSRIVNIINNVSMYEKYKEQGYDIGLFEGLIGS